MDVKRIGFCLNSGPRAPRSPRTTPQDAVSVQRSPFPPAAATRVLDDAVEAHRISAVRPARSARLSRVLTPLAQFQPADPVVLADDASALAHDGVCADSRDSARASQNTLRLSGENTTCSFSSAGNLPRTLRPSRIHRRISGPAPVPPVVVRTLRRSVPRERTRAEVLRAPGPRRSRPP